VPVERSTTYRVVKRFQGKRHRYGVSGVRG